MLSTQASSSTSSAWITNSSEAIEIQFLPAQDPEEQESFHPEFTYPIFGTHEQIYGYKDLRIQLLYACGSLTTYLSIDHSAVAGSNADDVIGTLKKFMPDDFLTNRDVFEERVQKEAKEFRPMGEKIAEYRVSEDGGDDRVYEIFKASFVTPRFKAYHRRLQIFMLLFVEGASYIDEEDERWEIALVFERSGGGSEPLYRIVGYATMYPYFHYPDKLRMRISQFLILPPFSNKGHGNRLYQTLYQEFLSREQIVEITVEGPNDAFSDLRDKNDLRYLISQNALKELEAPVPKETVAELRRKYKLTKRQTQRCIEIWLLKNLNKTDPDQIKRYRLQVKERLYRFNLDALSQMERHERLEKLEETYRNVEEDYHRILNLL
ncbi:uncharacterized protein VTP21DRAFT_3444 [Calcarisporiella thermophila]|uniref:uncharacterized protein n=1 Tax=Calcarisporiella thermophila TaxID=911321 RepID=UPI003744083F